MLVRCRTYCNVAGTNNNAKIAFPSHCRGALVSLRKYIWIVLSLSIIPFLDIAYRRSSPTSSPKPLGQAPIFAESPLVKMSQPEVVRLLQGDFLIIRDLRALPPVPRQGFTDSGGSRFVMANPGEDFQESDFISDFSIPRDRLISVGISHDRGFVQYEQGGSIVTGDHLRLFTLNSDGLKPVWYGWCRGGRAKTVEELRSRFANGACMHLFPLQAVAQHPLKPDGRSTFLVKTRVIPLTFSYKDSDVPGCTIPPTILRLGREQGHDYAMINPNIYSTREKNRSQFRIEPDYLPIRIQPCDFSSRPGQVHRLGRPARQGRL
jgi:hypothetical protein